MTHTQKSRQRELTAISKIHKPDTNYITTSNGATPIRGNNELGSKTLKAQKVKTHIEEQRHATDANKVAKTQELHTSFLQSWGDFSSQKFTPRDPIIHELGRGEVGIIAAVTNRGKSTLLRLIAICLACGRKFLPMVKAGPPRKVWLLDWETPKTILQADLCKMQEQLTENERQLVRENLAVTCDVMVDDEPFFLTRPDHLNLVKLHAQHFKADLLIIDTISAAYDVCDENANSEVGARIMKPTGRMARELNAAILLAHHIGKAGSEEGNAKEKAHLMRGASAFSTFASLVVNLLKGSTDDASILALAKVKGQSFDDVQLKLDREKRWFASSNASIQKPLSGYESLMALFTDDRQWKTADIELVLAKLYHKSTVKSFLAQAVKSGDLKQIRRGLYHKPNSSVLSSQDRLDESDEG